MSANPLLVRPPLTRDELNTLVEEASERGAKKALHTIGLGDEKAMQDVREIRSLIEAWRLVKTTMISTLAKAVTMGVLSAIAAYLFIKH